MLGCDGVRATLSTCPVAALNTTARLCPLGAFAPGGTGEYARVKVPPITSTYTGSDNVAAETAPGGMTALGCTASIALASVPEYTDSDEGVVPPP
jgi:hypothetical protein